MKTHTNNRTGLGQRKNTKRTSTWLCLGVSSILIGALLPSAQAESPTHDIAAATLAVAQPSTTDSNTIVVTVLNSVNDFRSRGAGGNNGDFDVQIGDDATDDAANGVLMSSVAELLRNNNGIRAYAAVSMTANNANGYWIPVSVAGGLAGGSNPEFNINVAGAWFPYATWLGGVAVDTINAGPLEVFTGSPQLTLGTHFIDNGGGRSVVDLTSLGIDSRTDGVLLVSGAKNESANFGLSQVNTTNGTWNLFIKDVGAAGIGSFEQDGIAFVFIPRTNTSVVSGRFLGDGTIDMFSDISPQFTVSNIANGRYILTIPGHPATNGVLIISAEGGGATNMDNMVTYQATPDNSGWEIQTRDTPGTTSVNPALESPSPTEAVVSFVYIPVATPGITVTPSQHLVTTESGGSADISVHLDTAPTGDVTVSVVSSDPGEGTVSTSSLTFTAGDWNVPQTVTVTGQDDAIADGTVAYNIILTPTSSDPIYNGLAPINISAVNADNESGFLITPTSGLLTTEDGVAATFSVRLNSMPTGDVTIGFTSSNTGEGTVFPSSLIFNSGNWDQDQIITVTGVDDPSDDGDVSYTVISAPATSSDAAYNGVNPVDVSVLNIDNDTAGITVLPTTGLTVTEAGTTANYTVVLQTKPTANVVVGVVSGNTAEGAVSPNSLTFTPSDWSTPKSVTITGVDDLIQDGDIAFSITNTFSSSDPNYAVFSPVSVSVTNFDTEAAINLSGVDTLFGLGMPPVGVVGRASIYDPYSPSYNGGTLRLTLTANGSSDDRLEIRNIGSGAGQIGVSGNTVSFGGTAIATFAGGTGTTPLVFTFNAASTPAAAEALLRVVTFRNINASPSLATRTVAIALVDGDGGVSTTVNQIVRVGLLRQSNFQQGVDWSYGTYTGEGDIQIHQPLPDTAFPLGNNTNTGLWLNWPDAAKANASQGLMRFDNIFGTNSGQVPTNAVIVSAELYLNINDPGDGSPLYRLLMDWDPETTTWNSFGFGTGILPNDSIARSVAESQIHMADGSSSTGTGVISTAVTPDVIAWANGELNYGWGMPGWFERADGTGVSPGETADMTKRPRLRVLWLPAGTASTSFRQGDTNGYLSAVDTHIKMNAPDTTGATAVTIFIDAISSGSTNNPDEALLRFDNIFGTAPGQIPANAQIHAAILDFASTGNLANGQGGQFYALLQPWDPATATWNTWVNGIDPDGIEAALTPTAKAGTAALTPFVQGGFNSFEVTPDVAAWSSGARNNYGWAILPWPGGGDGWAIGTSKAAVEGERPRLRVFYSPNSNAILKSLSWSPTSVTLQFIGVAGTEYSVQRSADVASGYITIGTATAAGDGTAGFTDNSPLPTTGFYRLSAP